MATDRAGLLRRLDELGIAHTTFDHVPVHTVEEAERHTGHLPGGHCKNLFLKDKKGGLWLLVCLNRRRIDINRLAKVLGCARLSFGKAALLEEVLGVAPGGVTPFALINDRDQRVQPLLDRAMLDLELLNYHPLTNAATTTIAAADLPRFIEACGHRPRILDLDATGVATAAGQRAAGAAQSRARPPISRLDSSPVCHAPCKVNGRAVGEQDEES